MADSASAGYLRLARDAVEAMRELWDDGGSTFWRDTAQRTSEGTPKKVYPTVTCRCAEELVMAMQLQELSLDEDEVRKMTAAVIKLRPEAIEKDSELGYLTFTLAQAVACCARVCASTLDAENASDALEAQCAALIRSVSDASLHDMHPFVRFHVIRALQLAREVLVGDLGDLEQLVVELVDSVRRDTNDLLAKHYAGLITPAEHVVLAFCGVVLAHGSLRDRKVALAALDAAVSAQAEVGSWPLGRVIQTEPSRLEISTYEVAWAVTACLRKLLDVDACNLSDPIASAALEAVVRATDFAERSLTEIADGTTRGWASDHPYQSPRVESWTSAIVLQFALAADDLRNESQTRSTLATFSVVHPKDDQWPPWLTWRNLSETAEPTEAYPVYAYVNAHLIQPILDSPSRVPSGAAGTASALLFGPPGTSKTTIVQAVAEALQWPLVRLSPGSFIENGLEAIESHARSVFERLQRLRRAVVLFDECDELFLDRGAGENSDATRTISAFVTASMLPKLQDLHDTGRVLFFICTNHVSAMDPAVLREGRIDHRIGVGPPDATARTRIVSALAALARSVDYGDVVLSELAKRAERFSRGELLQTGRGLLSVGGWSTEEDARRSAAAAVQKMADSLTISTSLYSQFLDDQARFSDPYIERTVTS